MLGLVVTDLIGTEDTTHGVTLKNIKTNEEILHRMRAGYFAAIGHKSNSDCQGRGGPDLAGHCARPPGIDLHQGCRAFAVVTVRLR
jgi:thioredoxin reductase